MIALAIAVAAGSALGFSSRVQPEYEATAKVFVGPRAIDKGDAASAIQELTFSREFVASYAEILKSRPLAEKVAEKTDAAISGTSLARNTRTKIVPETRLIEVTVNDHSPSQAQLFANEIVSTFVKDPDNQFGGGTEISASVFEPAVKPITPVSPKPLQNGLVGGFLGGFVGVALAFVLEHLDTAIKGKGDLERALAPLPVIAQVPMTSGRRREIFTEARPDSAEAEALRILRTNVQFFSAEAPIKKVLVTSPYQADGKTTVALNLAASMAAIGSRVILIETDLRKPVLHDILQLAQTPGLSNVLAGQVQLVDAIQKTRTPFLWAVTSGTVPPNPSELLGGERMVKLMQSASEMADMVILDSPPALPVTDALVLAPHTDGVILVVRAGKTPTDKAVDVVKNFLRHDVRMLGAVINGVLRDSGEESYYYKYRYSNKARAGLNGQSRWWQKSKAEDSLNDFLVAPRGPAGRPANKEGEAELDIPATKGSDKEP